MTYPGNYQYPATARNDVKQKAAARRKSAQMCDVYGIYRRETDAANQWEAEQLALIEADTCDVCELWLDEHENCINCDGPL